jgi:putative membrane protein
MSKFHSLVQNAEPLTQRGEDSTVKTAAAVSHNIFHRDLTPRQREIAGPAVHYSFGASTAALYGAAVEFVPLLCTGWGLPFGAAVWLGAHVITVPALGLSAPMTQSRPKEEVVEFGAHLVYGAVVEGLRRLFRACLFVG